MLKKNIFQIFLAVGIGIFFLCTTATLLEYQPTKSEIPDAILSGVYNNRQTLLLGTIFYSNLNLLFEGLEEESLYQPSTIVNNESGDGDGEILRRDLNR